MTRYYFTPQGTLLRTARPDDAGDTHYLYLEGKRLAHADEVDAEEAGLRDEGPGGRPLLALAVEDRMVFGGAADNNLLPVRPLLTMQQIKDLCNGIGWTDLPDIRGKYLIQRRRLRRTADSYDTYYTTVREDGMLVGAFYQRALKTDLPAAEFEGSTFDVALEIAADGPGVHRDEMIRIFKDLL